MGEWVRLVDRPAADEASEQTKEEAQSTVVWRLGECKGVAELLAVGEDVVVTVPTIQPTGQSFEILHGAESVVYAALKGESASRPTKRARNGGGRWHAGFFRV